MKTLSPIVKGLITGALMIIVSYLLFYNKITGSSALGYIVYGIYALGIIWTLLAHVRSGKATGQFGDLFGQGFRCFIIVTIVMVVFTYVYLSAHPEIPKESAQAYKEAMTAEAMKKDAGAGNRTPAEIAETADKFEKQFITNSISVTVFGTLVMGAIFTAVGSGVLLIMRRK